MGDEIVKIPINEEGVRHTNLIPPLEKQYIKNLENIFFLFLFYIFCL